MENKAYDGMIVVKLIYFSFLTVLFSLENRHSITSAILKEEVISVVCQLRF